MAGVIGATARMAGATISGAALVNTIVHPSVSGFPRSVVVNLNNSSSYMLINPQIHIESGYCCGAPQPTVGKGAAATCSFVKTTLSVCGAVGVLTYDITEDWDKQAVKRLAIMFSVPFDYTYFENWFALGLFETTQACNGALFQRMYYNNGPEFKRGKGSGSEIRHDGKGSTEYTLIGTMSSGRSAGIKVELRNKR